MQEGTNLLRTAVVAAGVSAIVTFVLIRVTRKLHLTTKPEADRWSKKRIPLLGGVALLAGFAVSYFLHGVPDGRILYVFATCGLLFALGLVDDLRKLNPSVKLIGQAAGACLLIYGGVYVNIWFPTIGIPLSILWFVGMSNAVNLLDNMDGVASGVCAISAGVLVYHASASGYPQIALAAAALCGACAGFVFFNFHPAKIYMGDCGSLFLGMTLGALGVMATYREATNVLVTLLVPIMVMGVPLFDMVFVSILRKGHGRAISVGGRDHTTHRLVSLGLSEPKTAIMFYAICLALGAASILAQAGVLLMLLVAGLSGSVLLMVAFLLGKVEVYREDEGPKSGALARAFEKYRRPAGLAFFDVLAVTASFVAAHFIRFDWQIPGHLENHIPMVLPVIIVIKFLTFLFLRLYSIEWEQVGRAEIWQLFKALSAGSAVCVAAMAVISGFGFQDISRSVFIIDWLLCLVLLGGARLLLPAIMGPRDA